MRSRAVREEIKLALKQAAMKGKNSQISFTNDAALVTEVRSRHPVHKKAKSKIRRSLTGGHSQWTAPKKKKTGPSQWEAAISREQAQYRQLEKHAAEVDLKHELNYRQVDAKPRAANFDD